AGGRSRDGERTSVSEAVKKSRRREIANKPAVFALIDEQARRISGAEIDRVTQTALERRALQIRVRVAQDQSGSFPVGILFWQKPGEDSPEGETDVERPKAKLRLKPFERRLGFVRNEDVDAVTLDPAVWR